MYSHSCLCIVATTSLIPWKTWSSPRIALWIALSLGPVPLLAFVISFLRSGCPCDGWCPRLCFLRWASAGTHVASFCTAVQDGAGSSCWSLAASCWGEAGGWAGRSSGWRVPVAGLRCFSGLLNITSSPVPARRQLLDPRWWPLAEDSVFCLQLESTQRGFWVGGGQSPLSSATQLPPQEGWEWSFGSHCPAFECGLFLPFTSCKKPQAS